MTRLLAYSKQSLPELVCKITGHIDTAIPDFLCGRCKRVDKEGKKAWDEWLEENLTKPIKKMATDYWPGKIIPWADWRDNPLEKNENL